MKLFGIEIGGARRQQLREMNAAHKEALAINGEMDRQRLMKGRVATPENSIRHMYHKMHVDPDLRQSILHIRHMDKVDGRVKQIHKRMARDVTKGGLMLKWKGTRDQKIIKLWEEFFQRLQLNNRNKLLSDARGAAMEGNLPIQWVVNDNRHITGGVRMPSETIVPRIDENGRFKNMAEAYKQVDPFTWKELARFSRWQLTMVRLEPDNFDDMGCMGRPYLDASRSIWQKLAMTEEDLVIRRRTRAPQKLSHVLEGATDEQLQAYEEKTRNESGEIQTDFFMNKKGTVTAIQGDANMDQIADVAYLLDTFFSGSPAPKGLFGYVEDLSRDVLEDLKADYFQEIDGLQDMISSAYQEGFELELLLQGINPNAYQFAIEFAERNTETRNQRADRALKLQALGVPQELVFEEAGMDVSRVKAKLEEEGNGHDPYPVQDEESNNRNRRPRVSVTPNNAPKGESATSISSGGGN
ncbi:hypothetical protein [Sansalvadorimonas verongulae]|uniref:hypothetical protein n=1 Tax=Sansalvadorimonas verongulae TaxID=2172824 RepID=UPI0012BB642C|nr:hypothetical protein [Sansalvadorimonas verongulae]MTI12104.1 hypothetical protein [Sansalvadorimonas verongulae]